MWLTSECLSQTLFHVIDPDVHGLISPDPYPAVTLLSGAIYQTAYIDQFPLT